MMKALFNQQSELNATTAVILHKPGTEVFLSSFHPAGSLFESSVGEESALKAHENFVKGLHACGVKHCFSFTDIMMAAPREKLVKLAMEILKYELVVSPDEVVDDATKEAEAKLLSDEYKRETLSTMNQKQLVDIIIWSPTVHLHRMPGGLKSGNVLAMTDVAVNPVGNILFMRDQQIVTARGLVIGALKEVQRRKENGLMKSMFDILGVPAAGYITRNDTPGAPIVSTLEGGDYIAAPNGLAFLGSGLRSNDGGAAQLFGRGLFGVRRVALVHDDNDRHQQRMHLDTVFNLVNESSCVVWEGMIKRKEVQRRVALYECDHAGMTLIKNGRCPMCCAEDDELRAAYEKMKCPKCDKPYRSCTCEFLPPAADGCPAHVRLPERVGTYKLVKDGVEFTEFLKQEGYTTVIPITEQEQMDYMVNFLNLGRMPTQDGTEGPVRLLSVHPGFEKKLRDAGISKSDVLVEYVDYAGITCMYGAAHCSTQAFRCPDISRFAEYSALFDDAEKRIHPTRQQDEEENGVEAPKVEVEAFKMPPRMTTPKPTAAED